MAQTEKAIERAILHRLNMEKSTWAIKYDPTSQYDPDKGYRLRPMKYVCIGMADIIVFTKIMGMFFTCFMEVKRPGGKQSKEQIAVEKRLTSMGGKYYVVRSEGEALHALDDFVNSVRHDLTERLVNIESISSKKKAH